ncbi:MAG TPA: hypothetical protein VGQ02_01300 [Candidatus Limnocylindrales bacterium]|nr:hypothetical protein [Candidatus Limnocylindrales bacterium]
MDMGFVPQVAFVAGAGVVGGLWLLIRGMRGYQTAMHIGDTATSRIATLAAGEIQVSGLIEPAELTLVSPLQSTACVYYKATVDRAGQYPDLTDEFTEERAVGFRIRDPSGDIRVFPRGARWDAPTRYDDSTGVMGDEPPGLALRTGPAISASDLDRDAAIAALTTVPRTPGFDALAILGGASGRYGVGTDRRRRYREDRLEPGDAVTIVGRALPFADLADPAEADIAEGSLASDDPEVSGDIAEAREAGLLADTPEDAWGNAAIPGFGIGRPTRAPELDPAASVLPLADPDDAMRSARRFEIAPEALVLASTPDLGLLIAYGVPQEAVGRGQGRFIVGLLGAVLAIGSAMALALMIAGGFGR